MNVSNNSISENSRRVLDKYPQWSAYLQEVQNKGSLRMNSLPAIIEIFDNLGLLLGFLFGEIIYSADRSLEDKSEFLAWFYDGNLALFIIDKEIILNRVTSNK